MNSAEVIKRLKREGYVLLRVRGSHHRFALGDRRVTVQHPQKDLPIGTLRNIFRQAGWPWPP